jgi:isopenicillin N synthase-like dioxygenase
LAKRFFDLEEEDKKKISIKNNKNFRGYSSYGEEKTKGIGDQKETYDLGLD